MIFDIDLSGNTMRCMLLLLLSIGLTACSDDDANGNSPNNGSPNNANATNNANSQNAMADMGADMALLPTSIVYALPGPLSGNDGRGGFRFGAATAAAQIEDGLTDSDWYWWTLPEAEGGAGEGTPVGDAVRGYTNALTDVELMAAMNLDAYRFSVDWSRIEPRRDQISQAGLDHYGAFIDALLAAGVTPMVTLHHFSSPLWVHDFSTPRCQAMGMPSDDDLCGWGHPVGGAEIIDEIAEFAALLAQTYGDRVDEWCTLNEPINYILASYGIGLFPPGENYLISDFDRLVDVYRNYLAAHVAIYEAIKANDLVDADGDGVAAHVGFSLSVADWQPARDGQPSDDPADVEAARRIWYVYHHLFPDALINGAFDTDLDGTADEERPEWQGKLDWLGVQYYFRAGVTSDPGLIQQLGATPCFDTFDFGACLEIEDQTKYVPSMRYEYYEPGIYNVINDMSARYPNLPLVVTEAGIAARNGTRRAENVVRTLEQIQRAIDEGADVRGYYHWSLMDNFEWAEGYEPKFGLYTVDLTTYERSPTEGATVYGQIAGARELTTAQREQYGGLGPMSPAVEE